MKRLLPHLFTTSFVIFLLLVVAVADRGEGARWWSFLDRVPYGDKFGHVGLIGVLSFCCNLSFPSRQRSGIRRFVSTTTLVLLVLVTAEEIAQAYNPHRTCDLLDWLADLVGLGAGQAAAAWIRRRFFS